MNARFFATAAAGVALLALAACGSGSSTPGATVTVTTPASAPANTATAQPGSGPNNSPNPLGQTDAQTCNNLANDYADASLSELQVQLQEAVNTGSPALTAGAQGLMGDVPPSGLGGDPWAADPSGDAAKIAAACQAAGVQLPAFPPESSWTS
jgi:hypothetical protein